MKISESILDELKKNQLLTFNAQSEEVGWVLEIKDGVIVVQGLDQVAYGEIIETESGIGAMVIDMLEDTVGAIVLGDYLKIKAGEMVKATGKILTIPVGEGLLGRVVNPLVVPQDGQRLPDLEKRYPIEKVAPGVVYRRMVSVPVQTGIKAVDALIPIGRGQRELVIGDRGTGKTTLTIDTIINQKKEGMICIYCAVGQKNSKIASIVDLLKKQKALDYTVVVSASATDPASLQYLAPYSACAIGEYFMDKGKDVLVIYDDLTKHAWAYRQISLVLRRPAGREAYPGDIFYLHSRLLERACRMDEKYGGGSLTAIPIIETLEGDVSAYIPTNVISITDGQIILEAELFNAGIRPAVNVGLSVSRVGGHAQTKAMKQVAGKLKLDLAQYRELAAFSQFESELDEETKKLLNRGAKVTQILKQKKTSPYDLASEVAVLWSVINGHLDTIPPEKLDLFESKLLAELEGSASKWADKINKNKVLEKADEEAIKKIVLKVLEGDEFKQEEKPAEMTQEEK